MVVVASAISSAVRGESLFLLLRGGADPVFLNGLGMTARQRTREALLLALGWITLFLLWEAYARFAKEGNGPRRLVRALAWGAVAAFSLAAIETAANLAFTEARWTLFGRVAGPFTDPNALGVAAGLLAPVLLAAGLVVDGRRLRIGSLPALVAGGAALAALERSGSRSGLLTLGAASALCVAGLFRAHPGARRRLAVLSAGGMAAVLVAAWLSPRDTAVARGGVLSRLAFAFESRSVAGLSNNRVVFWRAATEIVREQPLSGCGLGGFPFEFPSRFERATGERPSFTDNATNAILDVAAECGLPALLLALAVAVPVLVRSLEAAFGGAGTSPVVRASGAALVGFAVSSLFGSHQRFPEVAVLLAALAGMLTAAPSPGETGDGARVGRSGFTPPRRVLPVLVLSGVVSALLAAGLTSSPASAFRFGPWEGVFSVEEWAPGKWQRWMSARAVRRILPGESAVEIVLKSRRPDGKAVTVRADLDGRPVQNLVVGPGEERRLVVSVPPGTSALRLRMEPSFVPARVLPKSDDRRALTLLLAYDSGERAP